MKIKTFYINLEDDKKKNELIINELNKTNLKYERFNAINGKKYDKKYDKKISKIGKLICNHKILGCSLSHVILNGYISTSNLDYALILEDDIKINMNNRNITKEVKKIIRKTNKETPEWDIIKLHYFGPYFLQGSMAAYIINKKSAKKISELNIIYHADIQINNNFKIINYKNDIFNTRDNNIEYPFFLNYIFFGQKIGFYMLQHTLGIAGHTIKLYHIILALIPLIIIKDYKFIRNILIICFLFLYYVSYLSNFNLKEFTLQEMETITNEILSFVLNTDKKLFYYSKPTLENLKKDEKYFYENKNLEITIKHQLSKLEVMAEILNDLFRIKNLSISKEIIEIEESILNATNNSSKTILYAFLLQVLIFLIIQIFEIREVK